MKKPARRLMAKCYIDSGGDKDKTLALFEERAPQELGIDPATVVLLIRILVALVKWWVSTRSLNPYVKTKGEPVLNWTAEHNV